MRDEAAGRGRARDRAILQTLVAGTGLQVATVVAGIVSLPFVTRSLTAAEYGVLVTLTGFLALLAFTDLGIGSALTTRLSHVLGGRHPEASQAVTSTAIVTAMLTGAVVCVIGAAAAFVLPWQQVLGAPQVPEHTLAVAVALTAGCVGTSIPGSLGQRMLYGLHRGATANRWLVVATVLAAAASIVAAIVHAPLPWFVLASLGTPSLVGVACTATVLTRDSRLRPALNLVNRGEWNVLRATSGWYFVIAVSAAFGFQTDALIISGLVGAPAAGVYGVVVRVFGLVNQSLYPALLQLWPAFGDAYVRGDTDWVRSRLVRATVLVGAVAASASTVLVVVGDDVIRTWLTASLVPSTGVLLAAGAWTTYSLIQAPMFLLLNGVGRVRAHALMAAAVATINLPLSLVLASRIGVAGPLLGSLVSSVLIAAYPGLMIVRRVLSAEKSPSLSDGAGGAPVGSSSE